MTRHLPFFLAAFSACEQPSPTVADTGALPCDPAAAPFGGGVGTVDDPYAICAAHHLDAVRGEPGAFYRLDDDLDLAGEPLAPIPALSGAFDGAGHAIVGWTIDDPTRSMSLFTEITGEIQDLHLVDVALSGAARVAPLADTLSPGARATGIHVRGARLDSAAGVVSGVVLRVSEGATLEDVSFEGTISSTQHGFAAGIVGECLGRCAHLTVDGLIDGGDAWKIAGVTNYLSGEVAHCSVRATVRGGTRVAGVAAVLVGGSIDDCDVTGPISGLHWVAGAVAESWKRPGGRVSRARVAGPVSARTVHRGVGAAPIAAYTPVPVQITP